MGNSLGGLRATLVIGVLLFVSVIVRAATSSGDWSPAVRDDILEDERVVYLEKLGVFVVHTEDAPIALLDDAQHLDGEKVEYCESSMMFESPAHGEKFDSEGDYYAGPAAGGMDRVAVRVEGAAILVNPSEVTQGGRRSADSDLLPDKFDEPQGRFCVGT